MISVLFSWDFDSIVNLLVVGSATICGIRSVLQKAETAKLKADLLAAYQEVRDAASVKS